MKTKKRSVSDIVFAVLFGLTGMTALIGAIVCGATWHYATAACCGIIVAVLMSDGEKREK